MMRPNFPVQFCITDTHAYELWEIYQMIFEARYGRIEGVNHCGRREEFLEKAVG